MFPDKSKMKSLSLQSMKTDNELPVLANGSIQVIPPISGLLKQEKVSYCTHPSEHSYFQHSLNFKEQTNDMVNIETVSRHCLYNLRSYHCRNLKFSKQYTIKESFTDDEENIPNENVNVLNYNNARLLNNIQNDIIWKDKVGDTKPQNQERSSISKININECGNIDDLLKLPASVIKGSEILTNKKNKLPKIIKQAKDSTKTTNKFKILENIVQLQTSNYKNANVLSCEEMLENLSNNNNNTIKTISNYNKRKIYEELVQNSTEMYSKQQKHQKLLNESEPNYASNSRCKKTTDVSKIYKDNTEIQFKSTKGRQLFDAQNEIIISQSKVKKTPKRNSYNIIEIKKPQHNEIIIKQNPNNSNLDAFDSILTEGERLKMKNFQSVPVISNLHSFKNTHYKTMLNSHMDKSGSEDFRKHFHSLEEVMKIKWYQNFPTSARNKKPKCKENNKTMKIEKSVLPKSTNEKLNYLDMKKNRIIAGTNLKLMSSFKNIERETNDSPKQDIKTTNSHISQYVIQEMRSLNENNSVITDERIDNAELMKRLKHDFLFHLRNYMYYYMKMQNKRDIETDNHNHDFLFHLRNFMYYYMKIRSKRDMEIDNYKKTYDILSHLSKPYIIFKSNLPCKNF